MILKYTSGYHQMAEKLLYLISPSSILIKIVFLLLLFIVLGSQSRLSSHEIRPAIANIQIKSEEVLIKLELNLEIFLADINASAIKNTDLSTNSFDYDAFRAFAGNVLAKKFRDKSNKFINMVTVESNAQPLALNLIKVKVRNSSDLSLPRYSLLTFSAELQDDSDTIRISWEPKLGPLIVRQVASDTIAKDKLYTGYLKPGQKSGPIGRLGSKSITVASTVLTYIELGITHIVPKGLDHILFVLGLFLFSHKLSKLAWQITLFTFAHTVTLALASFNVIDVSAGIVEPLIALSICYVAIENIFRVQLGPSRLIVIFIFGLLHGLGFASVLNEIGLSQGQFITSLIAFNVGVEIGQLGIILLAYIGIASWFGNSIYYRSVIQIPGSIIIALFGGWWFVERVIMLM